jgi:hypothetical protein
VTGAVDLTAATEYVQTRSVVEWRAAVRPPLERRPCVFLLLA